MLSLRNLPLKNLKGYAARTAGMLAFTILMAAAAFGGTMVVGGVSRGLETVRSRLGADILVTPESAKDEFDAQSVLLQAEPGYFYMDRGVMDEIAQIDGIETMSGQLFMASTKAGCCSARVQMIAYDPETDFTITPWIADTFAAGEPGRMDVVAGSNVTVYDDRILRFYDQECRIVGQFAPTGSTLDNCVYMNFDTVKVLIEASFEKGLNAYPAFDPDDVISAVLVKAAPGTDIEVLAEDIREHVEGVSVTTSANMVSGIGENLRATARTVAILAVILWAAGMLMTILLFVLMIHERKREFAALSVMGADRSMISGIVTKEAMTVNLAGGAAGILLSLIVLVMFRNLIGQQLGAGFVLPSVGTAVLTAAATLLSVLLAGVLSSRIAVRNIGKMDISLVLKEGE
ncbi:MAG: ABC transporter permease [Eubacterium sp.]|nr:ABC transporter permease [Eubacterium sp.]